MKVDIEEKVRFFRSFLANPRQLEIINDSAENIEDYLDGANVDVIVSAIPFTSLPKTARQNMLAEVSRVLAPDGVMVAIQYSPLVEKDLKRVFASVRRRISPLNVPPAFLFRCSAALPQKEGTQR
jgi:phospholipid N-methyltransferase